MKTGLVVCLLLLAGMAFAQTSPSEREAMAVSEGAIVRALDMVTGELRDIEISAGETVRFRRLEITFTECRYPAGHPMRDAFAFLVIRDIREPEPRFRGWMVASSPALSAMDHPRYDVWVLRCKIPEAETSNGG
ncbi:MAG: DUF2155 domain-containing protein [Paracoccaceae bacterium]